MLWNQLVYYIVLIVLYCIEDSKELLFTDFLKKITIFKYIVNIQMFLIVSWL